MRKMNEVLVRFNRLGYKKKDNKENLPETTFKGKRPFWSIPEFQIEKSRWGGQGTDIRWWGWGNLVVYLLLITIPLLVYFFALRYIFNFEVERDLYGYTLGLGVLTGMGIGIWEWARGLVQTNEIWYNPKTLIMEKNPNPSFTHYRTFHLRNWAVMAVPLIGLLLIMVNKFGL